MRHPVAEHQRALERTAAQVEIAIAGADILAAIRLVLDGEGRGHRRVEYAEVRKPDLDVAGRQFGVLALAFLDHARGLDDELTAQGGHRLADLRVGRIVHAQLRDAVAVADVDETHTAHPAAFLYPAREGHGLTDMADSQFSTSVCAIHISSSFIRIGPSSGNLSPVRRTRRSNRQRSGGCRRSYSWHRDRLCRR